MWQGLALLCLFVASITAAPTLGALSRNTVNTVDVKTWSDYVFIEASVPVEQNTQISWSETTTTQLSFSSTSCTLSTKVQSCSFRVMAASSGSFAITFTVSNDNGQFPGGLAGMAFSFSQRAVRFDAPWTAAAWGATIGLPSEPVQIYLSTASTSDLTLTPTSDDSDIQLPGSVTIPAGSLSAKFKWICVRDKAAAINVAWEVTGSESSLYTEVLSGSRTFLVTKREIDVVTFSGIVALGNTAQGTLSFYTRDAANDTVTITPQAADTTFSPASVTLNAGGQSGSFDFVTTTSDNNKHVYFFLDQVTDSHDAYYANMAPVAINIPKETIQTQISSVIVQTGQCVLSIVLPRPVANGVTVSWYAANVQFNQSSVTFSGKTTSVVVSVNPTNQGPDLISFQVTGNDAVYYNEIDPIAISVGSGSFIGPDSWFIPPLYVGVESDKLPIRASFPPASGVTLTPVAADLKFSPATLTFTKDNEQQWFTITPQYTANDADQDYASTDVCFMITGADNTWFDAPPCFTVTIVQRTVQIAWSAHLYDNARHLHKEYKVWATANYVGANDAFSVTPSSPYFSFSPSTFYFNSKNTRVEFTATVIGVVGSTTVDYLLGGQDGGFYSIIGSSSLTTAVRPLAIAQANLAPDTRVAGELIYNPTNAQLTANHVFDFLLKSYVLPDSKLTITPRCNHATFSPKSITFKPSDAVTEIDKGAYIYDNVDVNYYYALPGLFLEANFTVQAQAAGIFEVWFELSDSDAPYYDVPNHVYFNMHTVTRPSYEPTQKDHSAASSFGPSMIAVAVTVVVAMFL